MSSNLFGGSNAGNKANKALSKYLDGLDTSTIDNTYKSLADNVYGLSKNLPAYAYGIDGSYEAQKNMQNSMFNQAASNITSQYTNDLSSAETRLQNQGLAVGSDAYQNALNTLQGSYYGAINNAAYDSMSKGQEAFSQSLNNAVTAGSFNNNSRQMALSEIMKVLEASPSSYKAAMDRFGSMNSAKPSTNPFGMDIGSIIEIGKFALPFLL